MVSCRIIFRIIFVILFVASIVLCILCHDRDCASYWVMGIVFGFIGFVSTFASTTSTTIKNNGS